MRDSVLRAGTSVHLVIEQNEQQEIVQVRSSSIHEVTGNALILAQTEPPLDPSYIGRTILITMLSTEGGKRVRYGFKARLERTEEHCLTSNAVKKFLIFAFKSDMHLNNLRFFYRLQPPKDLVSGTVNGHVVTITDLSFGGFRASWRTKKGVQPVDVVAVWLKTVNTVFQLEAEIRWIEEGRDRLKDFQIFGAQFINLQTKMKDELEKEIRQIERKIAARTSRLS